MKKNPLKYNQDWHPDRNKSPVASEKFMQINQAYEILIDEERRNMYDQYGTTSEPKQGGQQGKKLFYLLVKDLTLKLLTFFIGGFQRENYEQFFQQSGFNNFFGGGGFKFNFNNGQNRKNSEEEINKKYDYKYFVYLRSRFFKSFFI